MTVLAPSTLLDRDDTGSKEPHGSGAAVQDMYQRFQGDPQVFSESGAKLGGVFFVLAERASESHEERGRGVWCSYLSVIVMDSRGGNSNKSLQESRPKISQRHRLCDIIIDII